MNRRLSRLLLVVTWLALAAGPVAACGGEEEEKEQTAAEILQQTFRGGESAIEDGFLSLSFRLDPEGLLAVGGPVKFTLHGPFSAPRARELTRFNVDFVATLAEKPYKGSVLSTGKQALVTLDDGTYRVGGAVVDRLRRSARRRQQDRAGLPVTGFDPLRWISGPQKKRSERVTGVDTIRIGGKLNVARLLGDIDGLLTKAGGSASESTLLSAKLRRQIAAVTQSSSIDIWTGRSDKLLRQLAVKFVFLFEGDSSPLQALRGGTVNLRLRLDDVNKKAARPSAFARGRKDARPLADLTGGGPANILEGVGAGLTGGRGRELFACLTAANGSSSELVRCVSKLAP